MNNSESGARLGIRLQDVDLSALKMPFHSQWTYGAEWSKARILASDRTDARIEQPVDDTEDLKFEVHYRSWFGIAYFGLGRKASAEQSLPKLLATLESTVSGRMSAAAAAKLVIGDKLSECVFSECVFGVPMPGSKTRATRSPRQNLCRLRHWKRAQWTCTASSQLARPIPSCAN
ncbi:hypothetical protein GGD63_006622 [Bradyrhizobium sp. cir1]|uniref:hypothetical protein n=1 Tax=Bradyrhizobium sp. cir1 TaxID=1445730 RepID=UPI001606E92C|nr:hypothetical protein [Bradyrhizobium sp. cir1]MBB4373794.1 hypothetical protein [Bradyrhizobium sp. cir1]